ncbi:hypothetical protein [Actinacidiphila bryophytorum]|uniref:hypothetical protein n=1 Tax=Actinacidiphila bryophytorum TaxID=1436133 RepID=UPI002176D058|nr:hypothetical protein [Actinacidiphila bryophytorum]UWE10006.1 hypothetical protein NYE86_15650 [Actinacidiphila bryophytorum]
MRAIRRAVVALASVVLAGGLVTATSGTASAAAACPAQGHRIKTSGDATVYLIGPSNVMYRFEDTVEYFALYNSYSGIMTVSDDAYFACLDQQPDDGPWPLPYAELDKVSGTPKVYFYDAYHGGWRWITSQSVFDRYGFAASKIEPTPSVDRVDKNWS